MDDSANKILAQLQFGIANIETQMKTVEALANATALRVQETFAKTQLTSGGSDVPVAKTALQQAKIQAILQESEAKKASITSLGEAKITSQLAKEELTRQKIAKESAAARLATVKHQVEQEKLLYMQARKAAFEEKPTGFAGLMERRTSWLLTGGLVMGGLAGIYETASTIKDVEMGMTTIARVTEDAAFNFKGMRDELQQLGVTYGDTWENVSDIAIRWAQAGYDMSETLEATKDSLLALNTAELNTEQATNGMIAIMAQWGLTTDELLPTIDKINKVADDFAITSTDLVAGLQRSSGAAKVLGLTMNETIAILTTMREATGRTGKEVGNALNSILSFMQRDKAIGTFEDMGIQVFADDARTQFRNVIEIFDEMAAKWPQMGNAARDILTSEAEAAGLFSEEMSEAIGMQGQWNDMQQRDLSQAAAGVYRRNYLLALLQNWSKVDEVLISQENSLGYSMAENERTMQTLEKQIEVLKASAEQLAVALGDAGLLNELTALVEGVTDAVQWFNNLDDSTQMVLLTLAEVTIAVKLLSAAFKGLGVAGAIGGIGGLMAGWAVPIGATTAATRGLMSALTGVTALVGNLGKGIVAALGGPVAVGIIAVATALGAVARNMTKVNAEIIEHGQMAEGLAKEYDSVISKMDGMTQGTDEYNKAAKELSVLNGNIADSLPEVIDGWDTETDSIKINREAMEKVIEAGKDLKQSKEEQAEAIGKVRKAYQEEAQAHKNKAQDWGSDKNIISDLTDRREELTKALSKQTKGSEKAIEIQEALGETDELIAGIAQKAGLERNATVDKIIEKLDELQTAESNLAINTAKLEREKVFTVKQNSLRRLAIIQEELKAYDNPMSWGFTQAAGNFLKTISPFNSKNYDPNKPETAKYLNYENLTAQKAEEVSTANKAKAEIEAMDADITASINAINAIKTDALTGGGSTGGGSDKGGSSDWLSTFLDQTLAIAEAQARLNDATQRSIDILDARRTLLVDNAMTMSEYINGLNEQNGAEALLEKHQAGLHTEADAYRAAITALEAKQKTLNTSTDEGREAYNKIGDEIDNARQKVDELGQSWLSDEAAQRSIPTEKFREMSEWVERLVDMGAINLEQQLAIYDAVDKTKLTYAAQNELMEKQVDLGKQLLKQAVDKKIAEIEAENDAFKKASDAKIDAIQAELDLMDEQTEQLEEQKQIQESQANIAKARQNLANAQSKLSNVQGEKNTRIFKGGTWDYIADPQAVKDAQDEVADAQEALIDAQNSFNDTMIAIQQAQYRKELEAQIQHEKDLQADKDKAADESIAKLRDDLETANTELAQGGVTLDKTLNSLFTQLGITTDSQLAIMAQTVARYCAQMKSDLLSISEATGVNVMGIVGSFDSGGAIPATGLAMVHAGEYMLNTDNVRALGGISGVRNLLASLSFPKAISANSIVRSSNVTSKVTNDYGVKIDNVNLPQVVDASGLIRNLKQMAG